MDCNVITLIVMQQTTNTCSTQLCEYCIVKDYSAQENKKFIDIRDDVVEEEEALEETQGTHESKTLMRTSWEI